MTVLVPRGIAHVVQAVEHSSGSYRAECLCGWASGWTDVEVWAEAAARDHRAGSRSRRRVEELLADLLDLQDDLADAACWLADAWSEDLPVPELWPRADVRSGGGRSTGVALLVRCASREEVARVADVMGAAVVAEADGRRSVAAVRRGRVYVEASTTPTHTPR